MRRLLSAHIFIMPCRIHCMDIAFDVKPKTVRQGQSVSGMVSVSYPGRYDGVAINTQVLDSNYHITYTSLNDDMISSNVARLFIPKDEMPDNKAKFTAEMRFVPDRDYEIKIRASIIEQHKEIESAIVFLAYEMASQ